MVWSDIAKIILVLLVIVIIGNLWFHFVDGLLEKIKGVLFPPKNSVWHTLPEETKQETEETKQ